MKIPETSANVGAYYGNDENGQWQPNGVVIDNGVGGGVVGSGDAGVRPVYPVHIPRHMPTGYVMAGAYYPPQFGPPVPPQPTDFEDYMWMENEEEFDKQVIQQLEEEALMEQCIEAMLEDEQRERRGPRHPRQPRDPNAPTTSSCNGRSVSLQEAVSRSTLNPLAAEFVPTRPRTSDAPPPEVSESPKSTESESTPPETETDIEVPRPVEPSAPEAPSERAETPERAPPETEEAVSSAGETVEASAVVQSAAGKRERRAEPRRPNKAVQEVKKSKPQVRSEPQLKKEIREPRPAKSESDEPAEPTPLPTQNATVTEEEPSSGIKPINYAAAAKAVKPKPKPQDKEIKPKPQEKPKPEIKKTDIKPLEKKEAKPTKVNKDKVRKNSAK